jgi:hypothetical protein
MFEEGNFCIQFFYANSLHELLLTIMTDRNSYLPIKQKPHLKYTNMGHIDESAGVLLQNSFFVENIINSQCNQWHFNFFYSKQLSAIRLDFSQNLPEALTLMPTVTVKAFSFFLSSSEGHKHIQSYQKMFSFC